MGKSRNMLKSEQKLKPILRRRPPKPVSTSLRRQHVETVLKVIQKATRHYLRIRRGSHDMIQSHSDSQYLTALPFSHKA